MSTVLKGVDQFANSVNPMHNPMNWLADQASKVPGIGPELGAAGKFGANKPAEAYLIAMASEAGGEALGGGAVAGDGAAASLPADVSVGTTGAGGATATAGGLGAAGTTGLTTAQEIQLGLSAASLAKTALTPTPSMPGPATPTQMPNGPESQGGSAAQAMMAGSGQAGGAPGVAQTLLTGASGIDPSTIGLGKNILLGS